MATGQHPVGQITDKPVVRSWFFTTGASHKGGSGFWEVEATDYDAARLKMHQYFGPEWAFQYDDLAEIHPADRKQHGIIL